jgi:hypothetical protein
MHYQIVWNSPSGLLQAGSTALEDCPGGAPPPRVQEGKSTVGDHQVDRDTVRNSYSEEHAWRGGNPAVHPIDVDPPAAAIQAHQLNAVDLISQGNGAERRHLTAKRQPATHHLAYRLFAPQAKIKAASRLGAPTGNTGDDAVLLSPMGDLKPRNGAGDRHLYERR